MRIEIQQQNSLPPISYIIQTTRTYSFLELLCPKIKHTNQTASVSYFLHSVTPLAEYLSDANHAMMT